MNINFKQLIDMFVDGETNAVSGTERNPGTLKIVNNQLLHYSTPILERYNNKYILNVTRYSIQTGQVQKKIKEAIPEEKRISVKQVPSGKPLSLKDYIQ